MDYTNRASMSKKVKNINMVIICIVGSICALGLVMAVYSLINLKFVFPLIYLFAVLLGFSYLVMKINTIMPTYIERDKEYLYIQNWVNGLFPFIPDKGIVGEFTPDKTELKKIDISSIKKIYIGSKNYLLKVIEKDEFFEKLNTYKEKYDVTLKHMNILYIKTSDKNEVYMSVTDFDEEELISVFKPIVEANDNIDFKCSIRYISKAIPAKKYSF